MKVTLLVAAIFYLIPIWADINSTCFPCFVSNPLKSLQSRYYLHRVDEKAEILGMPKHKRWVLLANWMDRTLLRNRVAFRMAQATCMEWTPRGEFVEVVLNGKHVGKEDDFSLKFLKNWLTNNSQKR